MIALSVAAQGEAELATDGESKPVFADTPQEVSVVLRNTTADRQILSISMRTFQVSSSTLMPIDKAQPWKEVEILPGQTVLESAVVRLPPVKLATVFQIQWLGNDGQVLSKSRLVAVPRDIAQSISTITSDVTTGILDPENRIKPLFKEQNIDFEDLNDEDDLARFKGRLAILFFPSKQDRSKEIAELIARKSLAGTAIIATGLEEPSLNGIAVRLFRTGGGGVLLADSRLFKNLGTSAQSQLNLIQFVTLMLDPQPAP